MADPEAGQPTGDEQLLADILDARPALPVGEADISEWQRLAEEVEASQPGYALERMPLWVGKADEAINATTTPWVVYFDMCSSNPHYGQTLRGFFARRAGARARELAAELSSDDATRSLRGRNRGLVRMLEKDGRDELAQIAHADSSLLKPVARAASKDEPSRLLLESTIQDFLYGLTPQDLKFYKGRYHSLALGIEEMLANQQTVYSDAIQGTHVEGSRGLRILSRDDELSYIERISGLQVPTLRALEARQVLAQDPRSEAAKELASETQDAGEGIAELFVAWQATLLAQKIKADPKRYRPTRVLTMDSAPPEEIAISAIRNMPKSAQQTEVYTHAIKSLFDKNQHVTGNMFEIEFLPDKSLTLITCFDAWPFHFQTDPLIHGENADPGKVILDTLNVLYRKLAYGGKIVIFPWDIKGETYADTKAGKRMLNDVVTAFSAEVGQMVYVARASRSTLESWMSIADRQTAEQLSPVFDTRSDAFDALIITKPNETSQKAADNWIGKMATKAGTQG